MNKKILISLSIIGAVAAIAIGGTVAYFSDTETSTGNTFTAGSIDLKVDNHCYLNDKECVYVQDKGYYWDGEVMNGNECSCTWDLTDLDGELFFNFSDLKPGDWGEDTVSLHVYNNDAWVCVTFDNLKSLDNTCTEPEGEDECNTPGTGCCDEPGELAGELNFVFWADVCDDTGLEATPGDNIYQPSCDILLMQGPASDLVGQDPVTYTLADSQENNVGGTGALVGGDTYYIGKLWCFGDLVSYENGNIDCDGSQVDNSSQTDSLTGDIIFYAEQARNNTNFVCSQP